MAICRDVDGPKECPVEWSESERVKQILYTNAYMWHLEKWYWWTCLQDRNRDTDIENKHGYPEGKGVRETGRLGLIDIHYWYNV